MNMPVLYLQRQLNKDIHGYLFPNSNKLLCIWTTTFKGKPTRRTKTLNYAGDTYAVRWMKDAQ